MLCDTKSQLSLAMNKEKWWGLNFIDDWIQSSNDWFWRVQTFFLVFKGRKLPSKTLKLFYKLDQGCFAHDQSHGG